MSTPTDPFRDRVAVVTGGAAGIGLAMARAFAGRGAKLVLADVDGEALALAEKELAADGAHVLGVVTDVRERPELERLRERALSRFGRVHILCNNAGIALMGSITQVTPQEWETCFAINFWGVVHGTEVFAPHLLAQRDGHIVNTASMAGLVGMHGLGVYCATKFAVVGYSESLHRELEPQGVGVSVLCPMIVRTGIGANSRRMLGAPAAAETGAADEPAAGFGSVIPPEDVARRVLRAIERRDLYILTHPEQREILERRLARQLTAFEGWD